MTSGSRVNGTNFALTTGLHCVPLNNEQRLGMWVRQAYNVHLWLISCGVGIEWYCIIFNINTCCVFCLGKYIYCLSKQFYVWMTLRIPVILRYPKSLQTCLPIVSVKFTSSFVSSWSYSNTEKPTESIGTWPIYPHYKIKIMFISFMSSSDHFMQFFVCRF